ncbi:uncharacterized protein MYCGRDRAFT_95511 [Zymoseptoria tritici IPO323]|uniref:IBR domain-containing protein n=1 Tax=Zymoseptoria tritici (strain CBS 115943 / IPO323) TaxID=336722 RepID=F9XJU6_ZYMTI|nr:uncharacterized protein MYCGRDRAFT_95511 [Zymoseptoria tritici IPO323]EGP84813.1 hypothetical protein MYCGRDRAFT_95511 [Zymoseptoria tritici IPO323]
MRRQLPANTRRKCAWPANSGTQSISLLETGRFHVHGSTASHIIHASLESVVPVIRLTAAWHAVFQLPRFSFDNNTLRLSRGRPLLWISITVKTSSSTTHLGAYVIALTNGRKRLRSDSTASSPARPARKRRTPSLTDSIKLIECAVCMNSKPPGQFKKFPSCPINPCKRTCNFCCTRHVKISLIENPLTEIACFSCAELIPRQILVDQFLRSKEDKEHYQFRLKQAGLRERNERECIFGECIHFQIHDPAADGRLIACEKCCRQSCHPCMAPEHSGKTCEAYQSRLQTAHAAGEAATKDAFAQGYTAIEQIAAKGNKAHDPSCKNSIRSKEDTRFVQRKDGRPRVREKIHPSHPVEELKITSDDAENTSVVDGA